MSPEADRPPAAPALGERDPEPDQREVRLTDSRHILRSLISQSARTPPPEGAPSGRFAHASLRMWVPWYFGTSLPSEPGTSPPTALPPGEEPSRDDQALLGSILGLALTLRLLVWWYFEPTPTVADENWYLQTAHRLVGYGSRWWFDTSRPVPLTSGPVVPFWYASLILLFDAGARGMRLANAVLGALTVLPVARIGERLGGRRTGLASALLVAVHPDLITYSTRLWTEPVFLILWLTAFALLLSDERRRAALGAGALLGLAALARETGLLLPAAAAGWALLHHDRARRAVRVLLLGLAFVGTLAPWSLRLSADERGNGVVSRTSAYNLFIGNVAGDDAYQALGKTDPERAAAANQRAREAILAELPRWPWTKVRRTLPELLSPETLSVQQWSAPPGDPIRAAPRFEPPDAVRAAVGGMIGVVQLGLTTAGLGGLALALTARRGRSADVLALLIGVLAVSYAPAWLTFAKPRFAVPWMPVLMIGVAWLLTRGPAAWREAPWYARVAVVAVMAATVRVAMLHR
jgi:4-amino-4-deoxy-L-arabinose transferase-like glycosyltransferase